MLRRATFQRLRYRAKHMRRYLGELYWLLASQPEQVDHFMVYFAPDVRTASGDGRASATQKIMQAVEDIRVFDPRRYTRMLSVCRKILVLPAPTDFYLEEANVCVMSVDNVLEYSHAVTACAMVHEFTHAKIASYGIIAGLHPKWRSRMERICMDEEIAFLDRVPSSYYPGTQRYIEEARAGLPDDWWTPEGRKHRFDEWRAWRAANVPASE